MRTFADILVGCGENIALHHSDEMMRNGCTVLTLHDRYRLALHVLFGGETQHALHEALLVRQQALHVLKASGDPGRLIDKRLAALQQVSLCIAGAPASPSDSLRTGHGAIHSAHAALSS
ncbi:MAG: hypothetical protein PHW10_01385 [Candidatus Peribacteraceae bacterium]|nr:hypothetical protein [Candidatus Peribacteraceae bacterium]